MHWIIQFARDKLRGCDKYDSGQIERRLGEEGASPVSFFILYIEESLRNTRPSEFVSSMFAS